METRTTRALFAAIVAVAGRAAARLTDCGRGGRGIRGRGGSDCGRGGRGIRVSLFAVGVAVFSAVALPQAAQAQTTDIAVLHSRVDNIDATLVRMDDKFTKRLDRMYGRFERMDERLDRLEITAARTDERINGLQSQSNLIVTVLIAVLVPLQLATLGALIAFLTKGHYWGVDRAPKESGARSGHSAQPAASPA